MSDIHEVIYIAAPFFTAAQLEKVKNIETICDETKWVKYYSPRKFFVLSQNSTDDDKRTVFTSNTDAINGSRIILALVDEHDTGTYWEMGYAYGINKMVIMLLLDETKKLNIMLAQSCYRIIKGEKNLRTFLYGKDYGYAQAEIADGISLDFNWSATEVSWKHQVY